ncbi:hypothetical protein CBR_g24335 [Chara braunii]|uniref:Uncharacterized protein n=1 Tax=Chara braunii TaxID=69332 RepID=A0A388JME9_CHABU|nr:hypothetical protein CBR_g24335 [Chara braunii]|eukprot:GBG58986.1 hypothetical protein CBR_g24335 [Chara braunii]
MAAGCEFEEECSATRAGTRRPESGSGSPAGCPSCPKWAGDWSDPACPSSPDWGGDLSATAVSATSRADLGSSASGLGSSSSEHLLVPPPPPPSRPHEGGGGNDSCAPPGHARSVSGSGQEFAGCYRSSCRDRDVSWSARTAPPRASLAACLPSEPLSGSSSGSASGSPGSVLIPPPQAAASPPRGGDEGCERCARASLSRLAEESAESELGCPPSRPDSGRADRSRAPLLHISPPSFSSESGSSRGHLRSRSSLQELGSGSGYPLEWSVRTRPTTPRTPAARPQSESGSASGFSAPPSRPTDRKPEDRIASDSRPGCSPPIPEAPARSSSGSGSHSPSPPPPPPPPRCMATDIDDAEGQQTAPVQTSAGLAAATSPSNHPDPVASYPRTPTRPDTGSSGLPQPPPHYPPPAPPPPSPPLNSCPPWITVARDKRMTTADVSTPDSDLQSYPVC